MADTAFALVLNLHQPAYCQAVAAVAITSPPARAWSGPCSHRQRPAAIARRAPHRRRAGSLRSCQRARASADGRAYLARLATDV